MPDQGTCPVCGHPPYGVETRGLIDLLLHKPPHIECDALLEGDYGNGMSGGNEPCRCLHPSHIPSAG